jgi:hypothetical protein
MTRFVYQVCFPDSSTVVRSFPSLVRARSFLRTMSADDIPFIVMPWDENKIPLIKRTVKTPKKYITGPSQNVAILGPSQQKG